MKSTGVVRKIDEMGRVVIPKEIRNVLGIYDGDILETCCDIDSIVYDCHLPDSEVNICLDFYSRICRD